MDDKLLKALDKVEREINFEFQKINNFDFQTDEKKFTNIELNTFLDIFKQSLKTEPNNNRILIAIGWIYGELECWNDAIEMFKQVILVDTHYTDAYLFLAGSYI